MHCFVLAFGDHPFVLFAKLGKVVLADSGGATAVADSVAAGAPLAMPDPVEGVLDEPVVLPVLHAAGALFTPAASRKRAAHEVNTFLVQ